MYYNCRYVCSVAQSRPTLCNPLDCILPGFSVHGIFQARILEWVAISWYYFLIMLLCLKSVLVTQSCLTLYNPMDCSPPGSPVHGILQARILEWVAISFSRGSYRPRDQTQVSCTAGGFFIVWATREAKALPDFMGEVNWHDLPSCPWPQSTELLSQPLSLLGHLSAMSVPTISVGGGSLSISSPIYCWLHVTLGVQSYRHGSGGRW